MVAPKMPYTVEFTIRSDPEFRRAPTTEDPYGLELTLKLKDGDNKYTWTGTAPSGDSRLSDILSTLKKDGGVKIRCRTEAAKKVIKKINRGITRGSTEETQWETVEETTTVGTGDDTKEEGIEELVLQYGSAFFLLKGKLGEKE
jgi:hypothetical protein